jgi:hypothetical protein
MCYSLGYAKPVLIKDWHQASPDVEAVYGAAAANCRFSCEFTERDPERVKDIRVTFALADGQNIVIDDIGRHKEKSDPFQSAIADFFERLKVFPGGRLLEIGSRNRSGNVHRDRVPVGMEYVGLDIVPGDNVDVVADVHDLKGVFRQASFDAVFSLSTFEHLAMPWKVVLEINHILRKNGLVFVGSHQAWPLHEEPCDFWRFSVHGWDALFNVATGFRILEGVYGWPGSVVPHTLHPYFVGLWDQPAWLATGVLCEKITDTNLRWDVAVDDILGAQYPQ